MRFRERGGNFRLKFFCRIFLTHNCDRSNDNRFNGGLIVCNAIHFKKRINIVICLIKRKDFNPKYIERSVNDNS